MDITGRVDEGAIEAFHDIIGGEVLRSGDEGYDDARRVWNGRFDRYPAIVARCSGTTDVIAAVDFAREHDLPLSVKGGGHDYAGNGVGDGGLLIDLSPMNSVSVDPASRTARIQAGARWGAVDQAAQEFGLATTGATVSSVGVAGYTLGGGTGHLVRKLGLACDNLIATEVVTAGGERVRASEEENPELFWALRGGGGNFGVVTSFEFRLHEVGPEVLAGQIVHRYEDAGKVLRRYRDFMAGAPDDVQCYAFIIRIPPISVFPAESHGELALDLVVCHAGDPANGEEVLRPLREIGNPILDGVMPQPYTALQQAFDAGMAEDGNRWYSRAGYLAELSDQAIDTMLKHAEPLPGPFTTVYLEAEGGAISRADRTAMAFPHRDAPYAIHIFPGWTDPAQDDEVMEWARAFHEAMVPHMTGGVYVNLLGEDEEDRVRAAYGENYDRLTGIKRKWDADNRLRMNHNIAPTD